MSVTITSTPNDLQPLEGFVFEVNLASAGTDPVVNYIVYRFLGPDSEVLLDKTQIAFTGSAEKLDFTSQVAAFLSTGVPSLGSTAVANQTNFVQEFTLEAGLITFNRDTLAVTETLDQSETVKGVNSRVRPWELSALFNSGPPIVLSDRPNRNYVKRDQADWIYVYGNSGQVYVEVDANFVGGTSIKDNITVTTAEACKRIPIGPANLFSGPYSDPLVVYTVTIQETNSLGATLASYIFYVQEECNTKPIGEFIALEPLGGFSSLKVDQVQAGVGNSGVVFRAGAAPGTAKDATSGGRTRVNVRGRQVFTLSGTYQTDDGLELFLAGLFTSPEAYVRYYDRDGSRLVKCNILDGQYTTAQNNQTAYQVTVELHHNTHE